MKKKNKISNIKSGSRKRNAQEYDKREKRRNRQRKKTTEKKRKLKRS